ncbi:hypothetical protein NXS19_000085 [Fusarium pseudograminearum]|nr:hypothetical protein NXS19_000085 [Fusarium pseudograminearum]
MERVLWLFLDQSDDETLSSALMCQELATKIFEIHLRNYRNTAANAVHFMGKNHICFPSEFGSRTVNLEDPDVFKEAVRQARNAHLREVGAENLQVERFWVE